MAESQYEEYLFDSRREDKNQYSTFIQELQQSTQKLMNQVFNSEYVAHINEQEIVQQKLSKGQSKKSMLSLMTDSRKKQILNDFNTSKRSAVTKCTSQRQLSQSFVNFLTRNDKWKQKRIQRTKNQITKKEQNQLKNLTFIPSILRGSKQKIQPIYQRCLDIQKQKQKKIAVKRIQKQRKQTQKQSQYSYKPQITTKCKSRTLEQYLRDKQQWSNKKQEYIQNSKIIRDAMKYEQCIFQPILIAKYNKKNNLIRKGQKVQDRLLRTLQKSIQKQND